MGGLVSKQNLEQNEPLSSKELNLIITSWEAVPDKDELGIRLMIRLFCTDPEIKFLWIFASNLETEDEMYTNSDLKYHAKKVVNTLVKILVSLTATTTDTSEHVDLIRLGRRHHHYGIKKEHFKLFEDCLIYCLDKYIKNKTIFNDKTKKAWRKAVRHIFNQFLIGMNCEIDELKQQEKSKQNFKPKN